MGWLRVIKGTIWCPIWPPIIKIAIWLLRVPILGRGVVRSQLGAKVPKLHQNVGTCMGLVGQLLSQNWCCRTNMFGTPPPLNWPISNFKPRLPKVSSKLNSKLAESRWSVDNSIVLCHYCMLNDITYLLYFISFYFLYASVCSVVKGSFVICRRQVHISIIVISTGKAFDP